MVVVGQVARAHGHRGQVIVDPQTDFPDERFKPGSILFARRDGAIEPVTVESVRFHRGRPILGLAGVDSMSAAEDLAGTELRIGPASLQPLPPGSFYHHDLRGCVVETAEGQRVGEVARVEGAGEGSRLVVNGRGGEVLIPLVDSICVSIDTADGRIVIDPPEGLLDANAPTKQRL